MLPPWQSSDLRGSPEGALEVGELEWQECGFWATARPLRRWSALLNRGPSALLHPSLCLTTLRPDRIHPTNFPAHLFRPDKDLRYQMGCPEGRAEAVWVAGDVEGEVGPGEELRFVLAQDSRSLDGKFTVIQANDGWELNVPMEAFSASSAVYLLVGGCWDADGLVLLTADHKSRLDLHLDTHPELRRPKAKTADRSSLSRPSPHSYSKSLQSGGERDDDMTSRGFYGKRRGCPEWSQAFPGRPLDATLLAPRAQLNFSTRFEPEVGGRRRRGRLGPWPDPPASTADPVAQPARPQPPPKARPAPLSLGPEAEPSGSGASEPGPSGPGTSGSGWGRSSSGTQTVEGDCVVCLEERDDDVALVPCGHVICCGRCADRLWAQRLSTPARCPVCRQPLALKPVRLTYAP